MTIETTDSKTKWVKESAFGVWFLGTGTWIVHVLNRALNDLESLMDHKADSYSVILDIGYGHGHSLVMLDQRFSPEKIIAVDIDSGAQGRSEENIKQCRSTVECLLNDAASLSVPGQSVDMLFCHQTFHHLVDQENAIKEFYRVLKPGGVLLFAESCRRYIHSFWIKLLFRHPMDVQKTDDEYIELIKSAGFQVSENAVSRPFLWWSREDLGVLEKLGRKVPKEKEETLVNLIAIRPQE